MKKKASGAALIAAALGMSSLSFAEMIISVDVEKYYDDNIYTLDKDEVDSWIQKTRPGIEFLFSKGASDFKIGAELEKGYYTSDALSGTDDYLDYTWWAGADMEFNKRNRLNMLAQWKHGHDARGASRGDAIGRTGRTKAAQLTAQPSPDEWNQDSFDVTYNFGTPKAKFRFKLDAGYLNRTYTNHKPLTEIGERTESRLEGTAYFRVSPKSSVFFESRFKDIDYDHYGSNPHPSNGLPLAVNRDNDEQRYFLGVQWEATAKTTGEVKIGRQYKEPDQSGFNDYNDLAWEAEVVWQPKSYTSFKFFANRGVNDVNNAISYMLAEEWGARWTHDWKDNLSTFLAYTYTEDDYQDVELAGIGMDQDREDISHELSAGVEWKARQWLSVIGEYKYKERDSNIAGLDFERNIFMIGVEMEFK